MIPIQENIERERLIEDIETSQINKNAYENIVMTSLEC